LKDKVIEIILDAPVEEVQANMIGITLIYLKDGNKLMIKFMFLANFKKEKYMV
jgi:hypothetical protein